jgi:HEAT repeat protein
VTVDFRLERDALLLSLEREKRPSARAEAAESLCDVAFETPRSQYAEFVPAVVQLLADAQPDVKCAGLALAAEVLPAAEAKEVLIRALSDAEARVRIEACGRLADLALPDARGALAAALEDKEPGVRFEAARGMVALKHDAGLDVLLAALDDSDLRFRAAAALAHLGSARAVPRLKQVFSSWFLPAFDRTQLAGALAALGDPEGIAHLFKRAGRQWSMDRAMAIELLGEVKAPGARDHLVQVLADAQDSARGAAARGLGRLGEPSAEAALCAVLEEALVGDDVRLDVAEGLLRLGTQSARARVAALTFADREAQDELASMLAETPGPTS